MSAPQERQVGCARGLFSVPPLAVLTLVTAALTGCQADVTSTKGAFPSGAINRSEGSVADVSGRADDFLTVDCLLPGQIRKLGSSVTYVTPRRPLKTSAKDCEIRGGEYVAYDRSNYETALAVWLAEAEQGDPQAQTYVGEIYEKGLGRTPDFEKAAEWYERAAEQGYAAAEINLAHLYEQGLGVPRSKETALDWFRRASGLQEAGLEYVPATQLSSLRDQVERSSSEVERLREERSALEQQLAETREQLQNVRTESGADIEALVQAKEELAQQRETLNAELRQLEDARASLVERERAFEEIAEQQAQLERERAALAQREARLSATATELAKRETSLDKRENEQTSRQQEALEETQRELERQQAALENEQTELEAEQARLREQEAKLRTSAANQKANLRALRADVQQREAALEERSDKLATREKQLAERERQLESQSRELEVKRRELAQQETELERRSRELANQENAGTRSPGAETVPSDQTDNASRQIDIDFGKYYALVIGIDEYSYPLNGLETAVADAGAVAKVLAKRYGFTVNLLKNGEATRAGILGALDAYSQALDERSNLLIYYAGHGKLDPVNDDYGYWLPFGATDNRTNWISSREITSVLEAMGAKRVLVVADSCYSGALSTNAIPVPPYMGADLMTWRKHTARKRARIAFTSGDLQPVLDNRGGHSVFARALVNVLQDNSKILEGSRLHFKVAPLVFDYVEQDPTYGALKFARHEAGEFFFVPVEG